MAKTPLTNELRTKLLSLTEEDMTVSNISKLFGKTGSLKVVDGKRTFDINEPIFDTTLPLHLDAGEYINVEAVDTTVGIFLFNKLFIEYGTVAEVIPNHYYNEIITSKHWKKILEYVSGALTSGRLPIDPNLVKFLNNYEFYSMKLCTVFSPSYSRSMVETHPEIEKKKKELFKNRTFNNVQDMARTEDELVSYAREFLKNEPSMALFDSGARGSFENDYKNMNLTLGPVANSANGQYTMMKSSYKDGIQKEDIETAGNIVINSAYPKAVGTQRGGYMTKEFYAVFQSITVNEDEKSNCGTNKCLEFILTDQVPRTFYLFQNIMVGNKIVTLTPDNYGEFLNKKIRLRSPMYCLMEPKCAVCMGKRPYIMGQKNIGLTCGRVSNTLLNGSMKAFHSAKVKLDEIDLDKLLL